MRAIYQTIATLTVILLVFSGCKKTEEYPTEALSEYVPLVAGKYLTYRLDSTVFTNFGRTTETHSFLEKNVVDASVPDGMGRPSYRVFRFHRDVSGSGPWVPAGSYFITPLRNTVEVIENNLRQVRLSLPIQQDITWKGNRFLGNEPYSSFYNFSNDDNIADWDFTLTGVGETLELSGQSYSDVITLTQVDEAINVPITDARAYAAINYAVEKYAKGIGLVYQELIMWEYQPNPGGPSPYKVGFGVKRSLIDHN